MHGRAQSLIIDTVRGSHGIWRAEVQILDPSGSRLFQHVLSSGSHWPNLVLDVCSEFNIMGQWLTSHEILILQHLVQRGLPDRYMQLWAQQQADGSVSVEYADAVPGQPLPTPTKTLIGIPLTTTTVGAHVSAPTSPSVSAKHGAPAEDQDLLDLVTF